ncbi:L domain-like protein [Wallemia mellicola]|uniref:U2 small nuclear ribonucleoprotein A' n=2 Tax=Wallemia mellicola TaxID=1708541 RepID=A0A4T0P0W2_9BASI|nr:L domain-like protein [Wallemia mellicola]TIC05001.1 L domain-like protein [Wallemia mellicola]TIC08164.1 L domain-like protein [Wallemia mellicola]TIC15044.1 L domain-like protein [Wallemia mellicola]TIC18324.1 L domain-like protein [Wallemia mellicola]
MAVALREERPSAMVKITPELLANTPIRISPIEPSHELILSGLKIPSIENLGVTKDQLSTIILSHNLIHSIPLLPRLVNLNSLVLSHNLLTNIHPSIVKSAPRLTTLILDHNRLELGELNSLAGHPSLTYLDIRYNPAAETPRYRHWLIHTLPKLRVLDYDRVTDKERKEAREIFETQDGRPTAVAQEIKALKKEDVSETSNTFVPGEDTSKGRLLSAQDRENIRKAILEANSPDEVARLERMLRDGFIPGQE